MLDLSDANQRWENQVEESRLSNSYRKLLGIDGEPIEFEWNISQDLPHCRFSRRSRKTCKIETLNLNMLKDGSFSCQRSTTSDGQRKEMKKSVFQILKKVKAYAERFKLLRWKQKHIDEMDNGVWFEPIRTLVRRKCDTESTQEEKNVRGIGWSNGRCVVYKYGLYQDNGWELCGGPGTEKHWFHIC